MNLRRLLIILALASCAIPALGQNFPVSAGPTSWTLNGSTGTWTVSGLNGQSYCTVTVPSSATMGGGTLTLKTTPDNGANYFNVTGVPDLGSGSNASQTITSSGTALTFPVGASTGFEIVLSGASGAAIAGTWSCRNGSGALASNGGGGSGGTSTVTCASPGCVIASLPPPVQPSPLYTQPVTTPAPAATSAVDSGINVHVTNINVSPAPIATATAGVTPPPNAQWVQAVAVCGNLNTASVPTGDFMPLNCNAFGLLNVDCNGGCTPNPSPLPSASPGLAPPTSVAMVQSFDNCASTAAQAAVTVGNYISLQCDPQGKLYVSLDDPTVAYVKAAVATATTTELVAGVANKSIYIYLATWESTGTNATNTIQWEWGQGSTCGTNTVTLLPAAVQPGPATGEWLGGWAVATGATGNVSGMPSPPTRALVLPNNATPYNFCGVTAGTTTAGSFVTYSSIH